MGLDVHVVGQGETVDKALSNLKEVLSRNDAHIQILLRIGFLLCDPRSI
jgi:predicted RNase H-like HicB family nuclease